MRTRFLTPVVLCASLLLPLLGGCGADARDPDATWRCEWKAEHQCREYRPQLVDEGKGTARVQLEGPGSAPEQCETPNDSTGAGVFLEGRCPTENALGRCAEFPGYLSLHYYYAGWNGITSTDDARVDLMEDGCELRPPTTRAPVFQRPPFEN